MNPPTLSTKKRKNAFNSPSGVSSKKSKREQKHDKGRSKAKAKASTDSLDSFRTIEASLTLSIPAAFALDLRLGALELLDSMVMRYIPALEGVVLSHSGLRFLENPARIIADSPYFVCNVAFDATVWGPRIGMALEGKVNLCSPDHISLLIHRTFNASIPRHHIPTDRWEFQHGPAENDPEFAPGDEDTESSMDGGQWLDSLTAERLGGTTKLLKFTVIGLTVANEMLSLTGSIQEDPFSAEHVPPERKQSVRPTDDEEEVSERFERHPDTSDEDSNDAPDDESVPEPVPEPEPKPKRKRKTDVEVAEKKRRKKPETSEMKRKRSKKDKV